MSILLLHSLQIPHLFRPSILLHSFSILLTVDSFKNTLSILFFPKLMIHTPGLHCHPIRALPSHVDPDFQCPITLLTRYRVKQSEFSLLPLFLFREKAAASPLLPDLIEECETDFAGLTLRHRLRSLSVRYSLCPFRPRYYISTSFPRSVSAPDLCGAVSQGALFWSLLFTLLPLIAKELRKY